MEVIENLKELLKFKSITPKDDGALNYIGMIMEGFEPEFLEFNGVKNLILTKKNGDGPHLCFAGHIDVVPPGNGWEVEPFIPVQKDGYIYGRGAQDMKSGVAAFLSACKDASEFNGTLSIIITSDEEGDAIYGTLEVLKYLKQRNRLPDFAIVAEPTCETIMGDSIKVGRRGSINGTIIVKGIQGHAAYPQKCINPIHQIAPILSKFAGYDLDNGSKFFERSKIVITDIRGGMEVTNVTPNDVKIMFNVRNSDKTNLEDIKAYTQLIFSGLDYNLSLNQSSNEFLTNENSKIIRILTDSIDKICSIKTKLSTSGGTSDARYFSAFGVDVVEFGVINDRIHAINERVGVSEIESLYKIFKLLIENFN